MQRRSAGVLLDYAVSTQPRHLPPRCNLPLRFRLEGEDVALRFVDVDQRVHFFETDTARFYRHKPAPAGICKQQATDTRYNRHQAQAHRPATPAQVRGPAAS